MNDEKYFKLPVEMSYCCSKCKLGCEEEFMLVSGHLRRKVLIAAGYTHTDNALFDDGSTVVAPPGWEWQGMRLLCPDCAEKRNNESSFDVLRRRCVLLESTVTALIKLYNNTIDEVAAYDDRRRENMASCEAWRQRCYAAEERLRAIGEEVPE